jgi:hypothetical protein
MEVTCVIGRIHIFTISSHVQLSMKSTVRLILYWRHRAGIIIIIIINFNFVYFMCLKLG